MIVIRVELHSARTGEITEIARMGIANTGGDAKRGDYHVATYRGRTRDDLARRAVQRAGEVRDYPRLSIHVWHLVARALIALGYAGKAEALQPSDIDPPADAADLFARPSTENR